MASVDTHEAQVPAASLGRRRQALERLAIAVAFAVAAGWLAMMSYAVYLVIKAL